MSDSTETLDEEWIVVRPGLLRLVDTKCAIEQGPYDDRPMVSWDGLAWFWIASDLETAKAEVRAHRKRLIAFGYTP